MVSPLCYHWTHTKKGMEYFDINYFRLSLKRNIGMLKMRKERQSMFIVTSKLLADVLISICQRGNMNRNLKRKNQASLFKRIMD